MNGADAAEVLYGLKAISAGNGWGISAVGITTVFIGLVSLATLISQVHKLLALYDNPGMIIKLFTSKSKSSGTADTPKKYPILTEAQKQVCRQYSVLARTMDDVISLPKLLRIAELSGLKDPHANITILLKSGILCADEQGYFRWDEEMFDRATS